MIDEYHNLVYHLQRRGKEVEKKETSFGNDAKKKTGEEERGPMFMGMGMMRKLMGRRGSGGPMGGEEKGGEEDLSASPMPHMMAMCAEMLSSMDRTAAMAVFATPELQEMFREWREGLEGEALSCLAKDGATEIETLAARLGTTRESAIHLAATLALKGKVQLSLRLPDGH